MIISASRRTDIPAFYSQWFMNRIREGYFYRVNPFNSKQVAAFSLRAEHVEAVCFWTKNPRPLMQFLDELDEKGLHYYFQFTLNPYDKTIEPYLPPFHERIATFRELAGRIGAEKVVWRYDPVILSGMTPVSWHLEQAELIAGLLQDATRCLVFSFYDFYGRGERRLRKALAGSAGTLEDITAAEQKGALEQLAHGFKEIAGRRRLQIFSCSEELALESFGIEHGACIDGSLIRELFGGTVPAGKDRNQRQACGCVESVDMGIYNTCPFKCTYCYANFSEWAIQTNSRKHYPDSPALIGRYGEQVEIRTALVPGK